MSNNISSNVIENKSNVKTDNSSKMYSRLNSQNKQNKI